MANWKHGRSAARASAAALLYSADIVEGDAARLADEGSYPAEDFEFSEYAESLVKGVVAHQEHIDGYLERTSENWSLDRMPYMDRAILRLAVYEMMFADDVPVSVAIDEAVELAKAYGGEDESSRFVNGVLGKIARLMEEEEMGQGSLVPMSQDGTSAPTPSVPLSAEAAYADADAASDAGAEEPAGAHSVRSRDREEPAEGAEDAE